MYFALLSCSRPSPPPVDLVPFWQPGKANKACYHCRHTSNFLVPVRTAPSPSPLPAEITVPVNYYHHGAAHPAEAPCAARVFAVNVFWFLRRCTGRTLSPYMRGPLLANVFFLLGGHRTIVCLVECERCRYRYIEKIKGCCCKLITGSREPSPGNWEIKFLSLCMHVCARAPANRLSVQIHEPNSAYVRGLQSRFGCSTSSHPNSYVSDMSSDMWNQHCVQFARLGRPLTL